MTDLRKPRLSQWWQDKLNDAMEKNYPDIISSWSLIDAWKVDGWNDGTSTIFGVYQFGVEYRLCVFADYEKPRMITVRPKFEHTGWDDVSTGKEALK